VKKSSEERLQKVREEDKGWGVGLLDIVFPFFLPMKGVIWVGKKLSTMAEEDITDKSKVHEELLDLQMRYEMDEITEEEYNKKEDIILERLEAIRKYEEKKERR